MPRGRLDRWRACAPRQCVKGDREMKLRWWILGSAVCMVFAQGAIAEDVALSLEAPQACSTEAVLPEARQGVFLASRCVGYLSWTIWGKQYCDEDGSGHCSQTCATGETPNFQNHGDHCDCSCCWAQGS